MNLSQHINSIPLLREIGEPNLENSNILIILSNQLSNLPKWLKERKDIHIKKILIPDLHPHTPIHFSFPPRHGQPQIICGAEEIKNFSQENIIFINPGEYLVRKLFMDFPNLATNKVWLSGNIEKSLTCKNPFPEFYKKHADQLNNIYQLLKSFIDKNIFAARIKAIETGNPGYIPVSPFMEYEHPYIRLNKGDILIDGGVSDMVWAQEKFCKAVGESGQIYGFEPIKWMAEKAASQLSPYSNYRLYNFGLAEKEGEAKFASLHDSSHMTNNINTQYEICSLTTIDNFIDRNNIERINCIKLDIEGAELAALKGAQYTISQYKPKLIICLYHKPKDLYEIPAFIHNLMPEYNFQIGHSSCGFTDTILYASVPSHQTIK